MADIGHGHGLLEDRGDGSAGPDRGWTQRIASHGFDGCDRDLCEMGDLEVAACCSKTSVVTAIHGLGVMVRCVKVAVGLARGEKKYADDRKGKRKCCSTTLSEDIGPVGSVGFPRVGGLGRMLVESWQLEP
jgi:hypothetical protein